MRRNQFEDCPPLLREFLFYLETIKGRSARTVDGYYIDLRTFLRYIKAVKVEHHKQFAPESVRIDDLTNDDICSVTLTDIYAYLNYTIDTRSNQAATRARKVSSIRSFYNYITSKTDLLEVSPAKELDLPALRTSLPKFLSLEESLELMQTVSSAGNPRDYCMITFLINCGMRVSELVGINIADLRKREKTLRLLGKGNKERIIYVNDACLEAFAVYEPIRTQLLVNKKRTNEQALFLSRNGGRLTTRRVEQILEGYLRQAGLAGRGYSPHKLRHTAATLMYQYGGADVRVLKEILGHENLSTTEIYTHVSSQQMEKAIDSSPLAKMHPPKSHKKTTDSSTEDPTD